jgi:hypothetical protein
VSRPPLTAQHDRSPSFAALAVVVLLAPCMFTSDAQAREIAGRITTLQELGYTAPEYEGLSGQRRTKGLGFAYRLPHDAFQGPTVWWLVDLRYEIEFAGRTSTGKAFVLGLTNGYAATQDRFRVRRNGSRLAIRRSTFDLVRGWKESVTSRRLIKVRSRNYLQFSGVRPGRNVLSMEVETYGGVRVRSVRVSNKSAVVVTRRPPPKLALPTVGVSVDGPKDAVHQGDKFRVGFTLENRAVEPVHGITVQLLTRSAALGSVMPRQLPVPILRHRLHGEFSVRAEEEGRSQVVLWIGRGIDARPAALISLRVLARGDQSGLSRWSVIGLALIISVSALSLAFARRKTTERSPRSLDPLEAAIGEGVAHKRSGGRASAEARPV